VCPLCSSFVECALKTYRRHMDIFASAFQIKWMKRLNVTCVDSRSSAHNQTPLVNLLPAITITKMHHILNYLTLQVHEFLKTSRSFLFKKIFVETHLFQAWPLKVTYWAWSTNIDIVSELSDFIRCTICNIQSCENSIQLSKPIYISKKQIQTKRVELQIDYHWIQC